MVRGVKDLLGPLGPDVDVVDAGRAYGENGRLYGGYVSCVERHRRRHDHMIILKLKISMKPIAKVQVELTRAEGRITGI